jgi:DNA-binding NarL/FixJ family response regulator
MKKIIKTFVADSNFLIAEGLKNVLSSCEEIEVIGTASTGEVMTEEVCKLVPDVLLVDYSSDKLSFADITDVMRKMPSIRIIGIVHECDVNQVKRLIKLGINGHLMNDCDKDEIIDSVKSCAKGDKFFCGQVLDKLNWSEGQESAHGCDPINISERELEVLQLIAEGLTTKQIAEKLHLSFHTVMTHRKNMMAKLGLNNTAGLIVYAVKENLISPNKFLFSTTS